MIRVCVVDDHPALRTGLWTVIRSEPGMVFEGSASGADEALELIGQVRPDVVLVDYQLPKEDGLLLCQRLKALRDPPKVLVYSAYSDSALAIPALLAGADGMVSKAAPADELLDTIRRVARGRTALPPISPALIGASAAKLDPEDVPIFSMMMDSTSLSQVAEVMGVEEGELSAHLRAILGKLKVQTPKARLRG
jgi:DNA-binding NarL/FixJ family response regulator